MGRVFLAPQCPPLRKVGEQRPTLGLLHWLWESQLPVISPSKYSSWTLVKGTQGP